MNNKQYFIFAEKRSDVDMHIVIQRTISVSPAIPLVDKVHVPGKNGDVNYFDGSYSNRTIRMACYTSGKNIESNIREINRWLLDNQDYRRLYLNGDKEYFYMARAKAGVQENVFNRAINEFTIEFDCKPQKYLASGQDKMNVKSNAVLLNPSPSFTEPKIEITLPEGSNLMASFGIESIYSSEIGFINTKLGCPKHFFYDAETGIAEDDRGNNINEYIKSYNVKMFPGGNKITVSNTASQSIIPRWYTL